MKFLFTLITCTLLIVPSYADLYLQYIRGGNNRLDEANRDRNNGNRLFDSQNNNRGGVNAGNPTDREYYYEGSILPLTWTVQHGCGPTIGSCQMILQYMCDSQIRNGINQNDGNPAVTEQGDEPFRGRHESKEYYQRCRHRQRNSGLFIADQALQGNDARFTRQDNNGNRNGFECPEERDYYPYWDPSPWIDIAILTTNPERCPAYQAESQNVKGRYYCDIPITPDNIDDNAFIPITQTACTNAGGSWLYSPPKNSIDPTITAPDCRETTPSRDNHHGNAIGSRYTVMYNWTVPATTSDDATRNCVLRVRYNMTSGDIPFGGFDSWTTLGAGLDYNSNQDSDPPDNQNIDFWLPTKFDIHTKYGINYTQVATSFRRPTPATSTQVQMNTYASRGYVWKGQQQDSDKPQQRFPWVNIFGSLVPQTTLFLQLRINTDQYGRTFQDRSHVFSIRQRLSQQRGLKIYNVGVRGRRGNIVQCYPVTEYMFWPERLQLQVGDLIHFQWTGSDNAGQNDGQAPANKDRNNVVILRKTQYKEFGADHAHGQYLYSNETGHLGQFYPGLINDTSLGQYPFLGFGYEDLQMLALQGLNFTYFDLGPRQVTRTGIYSYLSTRNSAFSNRNEAATIVVLPRDASDPLPSAAASVYNDPNPQWNGYGWIDTGNYDITGAQTGAKLEMIDMGVDGDSHIQYVRPSVFTVGPGQSVNINIKHTKVGLNIGRMYWRANPTDQWMEVPHFSDQGDSTLYAVTAASPISGGYYKVANRPNGPAIAGVVIGIVIFFAIVTAIYWKIRVQPVGGWSIWWAGVRPAWCPTWLTSTSDTTAGGKLKKSSLSTNMSNDKQRLADIPKTPGQGPIATPSSWGNSTNLAPLTPASLPTTTPPPPAARSLTPANLPTSAPPPPAKKVATYSTAAAATSNAPTDMPMMAHTTRI